MSKAGVLAGNRSSQRGKYALFETDVSKSAKKVGDRPAYAGTIIEAGKVGKTNVEKAGSKGRD